MISRLAVAVFIITSVLSAGQRAAAQKAKEIVFGKTADGREVKLYTLKNKKGAEVDITNYGGHIVSIRVPDRHGKFADVVLGYDDVASYESDKAFFGATVGRYANRIAKARFALEGKTYQLPVNDGPNNLHSGPKGFNTKVWLAKDVSANGIEALQLSYDDKDGDEGFPGNMAVKVTFTLMADNALKISYEATTDKDTVLNLTNHSYFNLAGQGTGDILKHELTLYASRFTPIDATLIPTGELQSVKGTALDFTSSTPIGKRIGNDEEQLKLARGYDHNWVLDGAKNGKLALAARVYEPTSGRVLEVSTDQPGVQFYSGNFLDGTAKGKGGAVYNFRNGFCLETQHFPDSPNHPNFPSTELKPGQHFHSTTIFKFSVQ